MSLPLFIEANELHAEITKPDILVVDLCSEQNYLAGHIPGAVHITPKSLMSGQTPAPGRLPTLEHLTQLMGSIGLSPGKHVVVYDDEGGGWAGRFIWTLDVLGHKHYSYLNGGIHAWRSAGLSESTETPIPTHTQPSFELHTDVIAEIDDIMPNLGRDDFVIWDARSPAEYRGEKVLAKKGGHIPGAINCEWTSLMNPNQDLRLREDAKERLAAIGINKSQEIVTHCQSHHRSGFTYLVGKLFGFNIKAYPGSWSEWGNHPDTPVEQ